MLREQGIYQRHPLPDFSEARKHGLFFGLLVRVSDEVADDFRRTSYCRIKILVRYEFPRASLVNQKQTIEYAVLPHRIFRWAYRDLLFGIFFLGLGNERGRYNQSAREHRVCDGSNFSGGAAQQGLPTGNGFCLDGLEFIKTGRYCRRSVRNYSRHTRANRFEQLSSSVLQTSLEKPIPILSGLWLFARRAATTNIVGRELFAVS
jgi:hypothetical protein